MESCEGAEREWKVPETLQEAYELRDAAATSGERDFYQGYVYRLRKERYSRSWWKRVFGRWK